MALGIPCQWCSFLEGSHNLAKHKYFAHYIPCDNYSPLNPHDMREIDRKMHNSCFTWQVVLPRLGTNYTFDKYSQSSRL